MNRAANRAPATGDAAGARPRIFTWSFREALACDDELVVVRISIGKPRWITPAAAEAMPFVSELAPYGAFHIEDAEAFERAYVARLDRMGVDRIEGRFEAIERRRPGVPLVLCCFERDPAVCHRSSFAAWWHERTGEVIPEYRPTPP